MILIADTPNPKTVTSQVAEHGLVSNIGVFLVFGFWFLVFPLLLCGCSNTPATAPNPPRPSGLFPSNAQVTQRGILKTFRGEFPLTGYVALNEAGDRRLFLTETFGPVLADVLVQRDGTVHLMRADTKFPPAWVRRYVAADLRAVFGDPPPSPDPVQMLGTNHFLIQRRWYRLDLRTVEVKPGPQPPELFDPAHSAAIPK